MGGYTAPSQYAWRFVFKILRFATYSVYVGLSMSTDELAGDPYINFSLVGLVEIPAVIVAAFSAVRYNT